MRKAKKAIRIIIYILIAYIIGFESFYYFKNNGNVILYVSNQSQQIDSIDIRILVDGDEIVNNVFFSGNFHNYKEYPVKLSPIFLHEIEIVSEKAKAKTVIQTRFYFVNWILIDFWSENINTNNDSEGINNTGKNVYFSWFTIDRRLCPIVFM